MIPNQDEFNAWKANPTTRKIMVAIAEYVKDERITLAKKCGSDPSYDRFRSGVLSGIELGWDVENLFNFGEILNAGTEGTQTTY